MNEASRPWAQTSIGVCRNVVVGVKVNTRRPRKQPCMLVNESLQDVKKRGKSEYRTSKMYKISLNRRQACKIKWSIDMSWN